MKISLGFVFLGLFLFPFSLSFSRTFFPSRLIVWDVGQGQWVTWVEEKRCLHFDMGGEFYPRKVREVCAGKQNEILLSHWDMDHISFVFRFKREGLLLCVHHLPQGTHPWKQALARWPVCEKKPGDLQLFQPRLSHVPKSKNEQSSVFLLKRKALITGDAPAREEQRISLILREVEYLVVGHHGSRTSTSDELLKRMPHLKMAFASSRYQKYHHPHPQTVMRLKIKKVPLASTNDWGNLIVEF